MKADLISSVILPLGLAFIMFTLGVGLAVGDFKRVFKYPLAFSVGVLCHFVLLPLMGYAVITLFDVTGAMAVGFMIIAACPTGTTSNLLTYHARADVALALSFTAFAGIASIFTVPLILSWSIAHFMADSPNINFPYGMVMGQIFIILGLPVGLGMLLRAKAPVFTHRFQAKMSLAATLLFVVIVLAAVSKNMPALKEHGLTLAPMVFAINITMLLVGFGLTKLAGAPLRQAATVGIESSVQNGTLAIVIATSILMNDVMALPGAVYSVLMYVTGIAFVVVMRRYAPPLTAAEEATAQAAMH